MSELACRTELKLPLLETYLDAIEARLLSFDATATRGNSHLDFRFPFGAARFDLLEGHVVVHARSSDREGLARVKDLVGTAISVYAREDAPQIAWQGDLAGETQLPQFREMRVAAVLDLTPRMRRFRLGGEDLGRFARFGGMHVRLLFPTSEVPEPQWPTLGPDGLVAWPPVERKPVPRAYTVRRLDVAAGWIEVDFVIHPGDSVGSRWAELAVPGDVIGLMGPVGRPVPLDRQWYLMGADETGLPALARMLETLPPETAGEAWIEIAGPAERQAIANRTAIAVNWIHRDGKAAGSDTRLAERMIATPWPDDRSCFGWFAAEAAAADAVRRHWREGRGLGRDATLTATYWSRGTEGFMAGG